LSKVTFSPKKILGPKKNLLHQNESKNFFIELEGKKQSFMIVKEKKKAKKVQKSKEKKKKRKRKKNVKKTRIQIEQDRLFEKELKRFT